jgi:hypothetical protein
MALYIPIRKHSEDQHSVTYEYGVEKIGASIRVRSGSRLRNAPPEYDFGQFRINKQTGEVEIISLAERDADQRHFGRAAHKVKQHWEQGELPERTSWAA